MFDDASTPHKSLERLSTLLLAPQVLAEQPHSARERSTGSPYHAGALTLQCTLHQVCFVPINAYSQDFQYIGQ